MSKLVYNIIKKQNGEAFAKAIKNFDERIFDIDDLPKMVQYAGRDATPLLPYLFYCAVKESSAAQSSLDPFKLLEMAGYKAFYADTLKKQNSIQKYFAEGEELCTFKDSERYKQYYIIHAIKEEAEKLNRKDFKKPERQDEYGTSVISIQILKTGGFISIKNRYNHTVKGCDQTFDSNPDYIILGLSEALKKYFKVDFMAKQVPLPIRFINYKNQILYVNYECNNCYVGANFYYKDGNIFEIDKDYQCIAEDRIIDFKRKKVLPIFYVYDEYADVLTKEMKGKNIQRKKTKDGCEILLDGKPFLKLDEESYLKEVVLERATYLPSYSLSNCAKLEKLIAPNLKSMGHFCCHETNLKEVYVPKLQTIGSKCFCCGLKGDIFVFESLRGMGEECFFNTKAKELCFPVLNSISKSSLVLNERLEKVYAPQVKYIKANALITNVALKTLVVPSCLEVYNNALSYNFSLETLYLPRVRNIQYCSLSHNKNLKKIYVPKLKEIKYGSFFNNSDACYIEAENLVKIKERHLSVFHLYAPYCNLTTLDLANKYLQIRQYIKEDERLYNIFGILNWMRKRARGC